MRSIQEDKRKEVNPIKSIPPRASRKREEVS